MGGVPGRYPGSTDVTQEVPRKYRRYPGGTQEVPTLPRGYPGSMGVTREIKRMLNAFAGDMSRRELQDILHLKDDEHFRSACLKPAIEQKLIARTIPAKPSSGKQKYRLTKKGQSLRDQK